MSYARTATLLAALTALFVGGGYALEGEAGLIAGLIVALLLNTLAYREAGRLIFGRFSTREVTFAHHGELLRQLRHLAARGRLPTPRAFILDRAQPNAFATGERPDTASIAVTEGLLRNLNQNQVAGVLAHELGHVGNRDNMVLTLTATLGGSLLVCIGLLAVAPMAWIGLVSAEATLIVTALAAVLASLVQMAVSRSREFAADRTGAQICGRPEWIASALQEVGRLQAPLFSGGSRRLRGAALRLMMASFAGHSLGEWFSTHPSSSDRIDRLRRIAAGSARH